MDEDRFIADVIVTSVIAVVANLFLWLAMVGMVISTAKVIRLLIRKVRAMSATCRWYTTHRGDRLMIELEERSDVRGAGWDARLTGRIIRGDFVHGNRLADLAGEQLRIQGYWIAALQVADTNGAVYSYGPYERHPNADVNVNDFILSQCQ